MGILENVIYVVDFAVSTIYNICKKSRKEDGPCRDTLHYKKS